MSSGSVLPSAMNKLYLIYCISFVGWDIYVASVGCGFSLTAPIPLPPSSPYPLPIPPPILAPFVRAVRIELCMGLEQRDTASRTKRTELKRRIRSAPRLDDSIYVRVVRTLCTCFSSLLCVRAKLVATKSIIAYIRSI